jgi:hypothetical protein
MPRISRVAWVAWQGGSFLSPQIFCSLSLSLKPRLFEFGRVVWPGGGAGPRGRSPPPRAPPRRPGGGAGRRRWWPPPALHLDGGPPLRTTSKAAPPVRNLQCDPLLRATPTADRGWTQRRWLNLLHGESQTPLSPPRPVTGGATCSSSPPPEGVCVPSRAAAVPSSPPLIPSAKHDLMA